MKKHQLLASAALALSLTFGFGTVAQANPIGHKFCEVLMPPPPVFKARVVKAIERDKSGNSPIEGCKGTPRDLLEAWKEDAPPMTLADLPEFIGRFTEVEVDPSVTIWSACLRDDFNGVILHCQPNAVKDGEKIYGIGGTAYIREFCSNPINADTVEKVIVEANDCLTILFPTRNDEPGTQGLPVRIAQMGVSPVQPKCLALEVLGDPEVFRGVPQKCPQSYDRMIEGRRVKISCDWSDVESTARTTLHNGKVRVQNVSGSIYSLATGMNKLTIHRSAFKDGMVWICWELPNGKFRTLGVLEEHFVDGVATIPYEMIYGPRSR